MIRQNSYLSKSLDKLEKIQCLQIFWFMPTFSTAASNVSDSQRLTFELDLSLTHWHWVCQGLARLTENFIP